MEKSNVIVDSGELSKRIAEASQKGRGIVPLVGAGASAAAGIPLTSHLPTHLWLCIGMALGLDGDQEPNGVFWHPRSGPWPPMSGNWLERANACRQRIKDIAEYNLVNRYLPDEVWRSARNYLDAVNVARGSLGDWRLALQFLARLLPATGRGSDELTDEDEIAEIFTVPEDCNALDLKCRLDGLIQSEQPEVQLGVPDQNIIDSYFNFITAGRTPTMAHRILVHFRHALYCRVILSLNFDDLMERAFLEQGIEPSVYEVHHGSPPPAFSLLGSNPAIIKLHGGHWGVRADFSLDQEPSLRERRHFRGYFLGADWTYLRESESAKRSRNDLLIIGVSGNDGRVCALVEDVLERIEDGKFRVYWCCYNRWDVAQVESFIEDLDPILDARTRVVIGRIDHLGLTLWEIYHRTTRSPVPSGLTFPSNWNVSLPPSLTQEEEEIVTTELKEKLVDATDWYLRDSEPDNEKPVLEIVGEEGAKNPSSSHWGITALGWRLFSEWKTEANCLWLDLEDIEGEKDFAVRLIQAVETRLGCSHHAPTLDIEPQDGDEARYALRHAIDELHSLFARSPAEWIVFVNMRSSHGYGADMFSRLNFPEGYNERKVHPIEVIDGIRTFLEKLFKVDTYVSREHANLSQEHANFFRMVILGRDAQCFLKESKRVLLNKPIEPDSPEWAIENVSKLLDEIKSEGLLENSPKILRLRSLAMFPQVRQVSSLVTRAIDRVGSTSDVGWRAMTEQIINLKERRIIRSKTGGFLWIHWDIREELRSLMKKQFTELEECRPDLHIGQADWSMTLFESTKDPLAAYQAVYHRCTAAKLLVRLKAEHGDENALIDTMDEKIRVCLSEAIKHLERAHSSIFAWGHSIDAERCFKGVTVFLCWLFERRNLPAETESLIGWAFARCRILHLALLRDAGRTEDIAEILSQVFPEPVGSKWEELSGERSYEKSKIENSLVLEDANVLITRRQYKEASAKLGAILKRNCDINLKDLERLPDSEAIWRYIYDWNRDCEKTTPLLTSEATVLAVQALRRLLEIHLLEFEAVLVNSDDGYEPGAEAYKGWIRRATVYYQSARTIQRLVGDGSDERLLVSMSRIHSIFAGVKAHVGSSQTVQRHLIEAGISISRLPESEVHIAETVLQLRRVYCQFQSLWWDEQTKDDEVLRKRSQLFAHYCALSSDGDDGQVHILRGSEIEREILRARAALQAMDSQLEEAGERLATGRKSLWWWLTYARYRMVWFGQRELLRALDEIQLNQVQLGKRSERRQRRIERNGICLVRRHELESALHLLNGATRRVIDDSYQLCRIADTCLEIFKIARRFASVSGNLPALRKRTFSAALDQINSIEDAYGGSSGRDQNVVNYIKKVRGKLNLESSEA